MQSPWISSSCSAWKSCISAGDEVYLCADITDIAEGASATIKIVEKDTYGLSNIAATLVNLMGYEAPEIWDESMIEIVK